MTTLTSNARIAAGYEPITGYVLEEKIGQGGFGEVWRADAPGGLKKAVKFVFGATDASRGSRELKSLERIKGVHHPFLLTLERFGIVNDQLVIVTELADGSLEDIYDRHRDRGSCGIPRTALLSYLHDAADALDYLHSNYQLQHLDIKPGNLLLVGGHVKVADFGLLKDLREADCSIVGGLTPTYAPPEVFDGRPSLHSDQYSLAVMYQEMLTGTRPFGGRTIAQLATQHVHSAPNLEPLPAGDRPIIARALEKNPDRRFGSCLELMDSLKEARSRQTSATSAHGDREAMDTQPSAAFAQDGSSEPAIEDLPQLDSSAAEVHSRVTSHTLVLGLGGAGAECLHELRSRVAKLHSACPVDLHSVLIDTDMETVHASKLAEMSDRVPHCHCVHAGLREPRQYRAELASRFRSISRRWIYNVPRSRRTEGLRPLGRLSMVDHGQKIRDTLVEAIEHLAAVCGDRTPHVYVVGSIAGGTGGGMYLDVVHLLRSLLDNAGLQHVQILSLLASSSLRGNPAQPLQLHATQATLQEMRFYMQPGNGYPGDSGAGFPSVPAARTPLHHAYLVAESGTAQGRVTPIETIIDYLWADSSGAGELLNEARQQSGGDSSPASGSTFVRSVGVVRLGCVRALEENLLTPALVRHLLLRWLGRPNEAKQIAVPLCERLLKRCELSVAAMRQNFLQQVGEEDADRRSLLLGQLKRLPAAALADPDALENHIKSWASDITAVHSDRAMVASVVVALHREISVRLHDRRLDLTSAIEAVRLLKAKCVEFAQACESELSSLAEIAISESDELVTQLESACEFGVTQIDRLTFAQTAAFMKTLQRELDKVIERLESQASRVAQAIQLTKTEDRAEENPWMEMPQEIQAHFEKVLIRLHSVVVNDRLLDPLRQQPKDWDGERYVHELTQSALPMVEQIVDIAHGEQPRAVGDSDDTSENATATVTVGKSGMTSIGTFYSQNESLARTQPITPGSQAEARPRRWTEQTTIENALRAVRPSLLDCGGRQRLLLLVGNEGERKQLEEDVRKSHTGGLTVVLIPGITPMLIHEAQQIRLGDIIGRLNLVAGADRQVSTRLRSRADINWETGSPGAQTFAANCQAK